MKKKQGLMLVASLLAASSLGVVILEGTGANLLKAASEPTHYCASIVFGTTQYSSTSAVDTSDFTASNITVSSISTCTSCYAVSGSAARIGKSATQGILTFAFSSSVVITRAQVCCYRYAADSSADCTFSLATSALSADNFQAVSATSVASETAYNLDFTGLDGGTGAGSSSLTVKSTDTGRINLCKILLTITGVAPNGDYIGSSSQAPASSSQESSSTPSSTPSSSSSSTPTYNPTLSLSKTSLALTTGSSNGTITATYSDFPGTVTVTAQSSSTSIATASVSGSTITVTPVAAGSATITVTASDGTYTKTATCAVTVTASSGTAKTLMVRVNEILSGTYCDSIYLRYGPLDDSSYWDCLIDGGNSSDKTTVSSCLTAYCTDHKLDMYIGTHSHNDHMGIFTSATASDNVFVSGGITSFGTIVDHGSARSVGFLTSYINNVRPYMTSNGGTYIPVHSFFNSDSGYTSYQGQQLFTIDSNVSLRFLNTGCYLTPAATSDSDPNKTSVACVLSAWNQRYIFSGDGTGATQDGIISNNKDSSGNPLYWSSSNDVYLKANHHGSNTDSSNSQTWIDWVAPSHVLISAAVVAANSSSNSGITEQHPYVAAITRFEKATYDIHWNGINGTFTYSSTNGATPSLAGTAKQVPYYYGSSVASGEETTTLPMAKWCTSGAYTSCARSTATGKDSAAASPISTHFHDYDIGWLYHGSTTYNLPDKVSSLDEETYRAPNGTGEIYDELTDSYC